MIARSWLEEADKQSTALMNKNHIGGDNIG